MSRKRKGTAGKERWTDLEVAIMQRLFHDTINAMRVQRGKEHPHLFATPRPGLIPPAEKPGLPSCWAWRGTPTRRAALPKETHQ
jgi:hypothetical protein